MATTKTKKIKSNPMPAARFAKVDAGAAFSFNGKRLKKYMTTGA